MLPIVPAPDTGQQEEAFEAEVRRNRKKAAVADFAHLIKDFCNKICHKRTQAPQQPRPSFNHFVGEREKGRWNLDADRFCGL
jgi:hypothetical protein